MHWENGLTQHTPETVRLHKQPRQMTECSCIRRRAQLDAEFNNFIFSNSKPGGGGSVGSHHKTDRLRFRKFYLDKHPRQMTERIYIEDELWYIYSLECYHGCQVTK